MKLKSTAASSEMVFAVLRGVLALAGVLSLSRASHRGSHTGKPPPKVFPVIHNILPRYPSPNGGDRITIYGRNLQPFDEARSMAEWASGQFPKGIYLEKAGPCTNATFGPNQTTASCTLPPSTEVDYLSYVNERGAFTMHPEGIHYRAPFIFTLNTTWTMEGYIVTVLGKDFSKSNDEVPLGTKAKAHVPFSTCKRRPG